MPIFRLITVRMCSGASLLSRALVGSPDELAILFLANVRDNMFMLSARVRRPQIIAGLLLTAVVVLSACNTDNGVDGGGSGIRPGTPAPTSSAPTATVVLNATSTPVVLASSTSIAVSPTASPVPGATPTATTPATGTQPTPTVTVSAPTPSPTSVPAPTSSPVPTSTTTPPVEPEPLKPLQLERVFAWSSPTRPTHLEEASDSSGRIFVSEQAGRILELTGSPAAQNGGERVVLDIRSRVTGRGNEEGLLGFALHPEFSQNGRIFVYYSATNLRRSIVSEFRFKANGTIDPTSERKVLEVSQPQPNHNGGMLAFGPDDFLYISLGDGGGAGDQGDNGQNPGNVLGTILRIDIDSSGQAYASPPDNPFIQGGGAPEIWAYGLRNPWRFSFDTETGDLWAGDVGQNRIEEIDLIVRGGNYGWRLKEGPDCFNPSSGCDQPNLIEPVTSYSHSFGCSVTGGYVYRGSRLPSLSGAYVYADFCSGIIWGLRHQDGAVQEQIILIDTNHQIPAFGQTLNGEVYVLTHSPGIFRLADQ